jgi:hypothetical protein
MSNQKEIILLTLNIIIDFLTIIENIKRITKKRKLNITETINKEFIILIINSNRLILIL